MARYALMGDGKTVEGELDEEQRGWDAYLAANPSYERYDFISEGDSPSFLYLVDTGLRSLEDPSWGGWGGRFGSDGVNTVADYDPYSGRYEASYTLTRWFDDLQSDFAARVRWCTAERFEDANHAPQLRVAEGIDVYAAPGERVTLTAEASDPDGDELSYRWWRYVEADSYGVPVPTPADSKMGEFLLDRTAEAGDAGASDSVVLAGAHTAQVTFTVPADARPGDTLHLVAEATDDGAPALKRYQRVVVTVA